MIYSYESLFQKWINEKSPMKLYLLGKSLKDEDDSFLLDDPEEILLEAAEVQDAQTFLAVLFSFNFEDLEDISIDFEDSFFTDVFNAYKESALGEVQKLVLRQIKEEHQFKLL